MAQIKGPAIFLAQFLGDQAPFDNLPNITAWASSLGYLGVQLPAWDARVIDIKKAAESKTYCHDLQGQTNGLAITELASHLQGQLVAVHPAYNELFDAFAAPEVRGDPKARAQWAVNQVKLTIKASANLGLTVMGTFPGALLWPFMYPWPQRPAGLVEEGFKELAKRWKPILDYADKFGVDCAFELHPGEDLHDGVTFDRFLEATGNHPRVKILYDPSHFILQRRVPALGQGRRLRQFFRLERASGPLPQPRRRPGGFQTGLHAPHRRRLQLLGRARVGVLL